MSDYYNPLVQQEFLDTCAIKSQQLILNDFGVDVSEADLVHTAAENGWYNGGTAPEDVGKLLELADIPVTRQDGANIFNLVSELAQGHKVIVGVDSDELWRNNTPFQKFKNWWDDFWGKEQGDHALIVAGIDTTDPNNLQVIVRDPGSGEDGKPYPLDQFMDAWSDARCYMVSTDVAVPSVVDGMQNFDYALGHLDKVVGMDYSRFQIFNDLSYGLPSFSPKGFDANGDQMFDVPMNSLVDSFFDVANNQIPFSQIFSPQYDFNNYLDFSAINPTICDTFTQGYSSMLDSTVPSWDTFAFNHGVVEMTNLDYANYLTEMIAMFDPVADSQMLDFYNQQMMMVDYCNSNNLDFVDVIYNPSLEILGL